MIRYCCDWCHRDIDPNGELRYVVKMEVFAAFDPASELEYADERNHLQEIQDILEQVEAVDPYQSGEDIYREIRYDLCPECHKRFMRNPLGRENKKSLNFSKN